MTLIGDFESQLFQQRLLQQQEAERRRQEEEAKRPNPLGAILGGITGFLTGGPLGAVLGGLGGLQATQAGGAPAVAQAALGGYSLGSALDTQEKQKKALAKLQEAKSDIDILKNAFTIAPESVIKASLSRAFPSALEQFLGLQSSDNKLGDIFGQITGDSESVDVPEGSIFIRTDGKVKIVRNGQIEDYTP